MRGTGDRGGRRSSDLQGGCSRSARAGGRTRAGLGRGQPWWSAGGVPGYGTGKPISGGSRVAGESRRNEDPLARRDHPTDLRDPMGTHPNAARPHPGAHWRAAKRSHARPRSLRSRPPGREPSRHPTTSGTQEASDAVARSAARLLPIRGGGTSAAVDPAVVRRVAAREAPRSWADRASSAAPVDRSAGGVWLFALMLWSVWFYRAVFAGACAIGIVLFGFSAPSTGLLVILCGAGIVVIGAFANAYHEQGKRGVCQGGTRWPGRLPLELSRLLAANGRAFRQTRNCHRVRDRSA
jgi:hypothetical protein